MDSYPELCNSLSIQTRIVGLQFNSVRQTLRLGHELSGLLGHRPNRMDFFHRSRYLKGEHLSNQQAVISGCHMRMAPGLAAD